MLGISKSLVFANEDLYFTDMNWKLAIDTFEKRIIFLLHKDSLLSPFTVTVRCLIASNGNGRLILCKRTIDDMRKLPESEWDICAGSLPVYYLFPI